MGHSEHEPAAKKLRPWNAERLVGAKRALKAQQVWAIRFWLAHESRLRDQAMFDLAIDSKLRGCDVGEGQDGDLVTGGRIRARHGCATEDRPASPSLRCWSRPGPACSHGLSAVVERWTILSFQAGPMALLTSAPRQYARLVDEWVIGIGLRPEEYGTHSLRRTKASIIYKQTGNLRAVQILLGHTKIESTVRYLGVDVEDALALAEKDRIIGIAGLPSAQREEAQRNEIDCDNAHSSMVPTLPRRRTLNADIGPDRQFAWKETP